jgi:hypothetical protein
VSLVKREKYGDFHKLRFLTGEQKGNQVPDKFPTLAKLDKWVTDNGAELVKSISVYRQIEIMKGRLSNWYAFGLCGTQVFTDYTFTTEQHVKTIIDWHHDK